MVKNDRISASPTAYPGETRRAVLRRGAVVSATVAAVGVLAACGRKGDLEPPPGAKGADVKGKTG
jgi:predicted small lipoprotein YifL